MTFLRPALAGAVATFSGVGLSRFAYVPLFPAMVAAGWISGTEGGALGALNLAGYLGGVLGGRDLARRLGTRAALVFGLGLAIASFAFCAWNLGAVWLGVWRTSSGVAGGLLMALAGPAVQGSVAPSRRGLAGGIVISGVAVGIIAGTLLVPAALPLGLPAAWLGLAGLVAAAVAIVARDLPGTPIPPATAPVIRATSLHLAYGASGAGLVPHMVYFADLAVRGRGFSTDTAAGLWLVFGIGALAGPLLGGRAVDRVGSLLAFRIWLGFQVLALATSLAGSVALLGLSAFLGGFSSIGLTAIALARARELAGAGAGALWVRSTAAFAVAQAGGGILFAFLFGATASHDAIFLAALIISVGALLIGLVGPVYLDSAPHPAEHG